MSIKTITTGVLSITLLAGCAAPKKPDTVKANNGSTLDVSSTFAQAEINNNHHPDTTLRLVSPAHSGAGMGLAVLGAVLGGGASTNPFDKDSYKGSSIDSMPEPTAQYLTPKAEGKIREWLDKQSGNYSYKEPLVIAASRWSLVYTDMSASNSNYDLTYRVLFYKRPEGGTMFSSFVTAECSPSIKTAPLADWQANNYQKVTEETQKMMDACVLELENQLPRLLKK